MHEKPRPQLVTAAHKQHRCGTYARCQWNSACQFAGAAGWPGVMGAATITPCAAGASSAVIGCAKHADTDRADRKVGRKDHDNSSLR